MQVFLQERTLYTLLAISLHIQPYERKLYTLFFSCSDAYIWKRSLRDEPDYKLYPGFLVRRLEHFEKLKKYIGRY